MIKNKKPKSTNRQTVAENKRQFCNIVMGDKALVFFFESVRKAKHDNRTVVAKRTINTKKKSIAHSFHVPKANVLHEDIIDILQSSYTTLFVRI